MKVLMVEDNAGDVGLVRGALEEAGETGIETVSARSLREACEQLAESRFDAVLLDLSLPDACGLEGLTQITDLAPQVPIVVLSGLQDERLALQAVQLGAQDYLVKNEWDGRGGVLARVIRYAIERKHSEQYINHLAYHDELTGLPNRRLFLDHLALAVERARRNNRMLAVVFIDLDRFKEINDSMGHKIGDQILHEVAVRLRASTRASDTVARVGGDEFTLLLPDISRVEDVMVLADKLLDALRASFTLEGQEMRLSASLGITLYPNDANDADALLGRADEAMYRAKEEGRSVFRFYEPSMNARALERFELGQALSQAFKRGELVLHFQPIVDLERGKTRGIEALLRWRHPQLGLLEPHRFLRFAEMNGLILSIGEWVLHEAIEQARVLALEGLTGLTVWINVSNRQLDSKRFLLAASRAVRAIGLPEGSLGFELTESILLRDDDETAEAMRILSDLGVVFANDDFGLGLSSLRRLLRFPVEVIKIDQSLIREIPRNTEDVRIVSAIVAMTHSLGLTVVGEGVESDEQLKFLRQIGCDQGQGFLFSRAMSAQEILELLRIDGSWHEQWSRTD